MSASTISPMTAIVEDFDPFAAIATNTKRPSLQVQNSGPVGRSSSAMVTGSTSLIPSVMNPSNSRSVSIDSAPAKSIFSSIAQADRRSSHPALNSEIPNSAPPMYSVAVPPPQPTSAASAAAFVAPPHLPKPGMMLVPVSGIGPSGQPTTIMVSIPVGGSLTVHANGSTLINQPNTPPSQTRPTGPRERHNSNDSTVASPVASPTNAGQSAAAHRNANSRDIQKRNLYIATSPNLPPVHTNTDSASGLDFDAIAARPSPSSRSRHTGSDGLTVALSLPPQSPHSTNKPISPAEAAAMISPQLAELNNKPPNAAKSPVGRKNFSIAHPIGEFDSAGKGESDETVEDETKTHDETLQVPGSGRQSRRNSVDRNHRAHSMITTHSSKSPGAGHGHNHGHSHANGSGGSPAAVASGSPTPISPTSPKHSKKSSTRTTKHHKDSTTEKEEDPQAAKERIVRKIAERDKRADAWTFSKSKTSTTLGFVKNCLVWKFVLRPRTSDLPAPISSAAASVPASTSVAIARDEEHEVELFHSIMGGKRTVKVDGAVIVQEKKLLDGGSRYTFEVGALAETRVPCILDILATGSEFQYEFTVDGIPWSESKEKFMNAMNKEYEKIYTKAQSLGIKVEPLGVAGIIDQIKTSAANGNVLANNYSGPVYGPVL